MLAVLLVAAVAAGIASAAGEGRRGHERIAIAARFSSGKRGSDPVYGAFWSALCATGADIVLVGHDHDYERFAPQTPSGVRDTGRGIRRFVVGTGGDSVRGFDSTEANSEVRDATTLGILRLTLRSGAYGWRFVPAVGSFTDSGTDTCH